MCIAANLPKGLLFIINTTIVFFIFKELLCNACTSFCCSVFELSCFSLFQKLMKPAVIFIKVSELRKRFEGKSTSASDWEMNR